MTCAHVIFGLPGEGRSEMEDTIRLLSDLQVEGIKFHHLYIVKNTELNSSTGLVTINPLHRKIMWKWLHGPLRPFPKAL